MYSEDFDGNTVCPIPFIEIGPQLEDYYIDWDYRLSHVQAVPEGHRQEWEDFTAAQRNWKRTLVPYNLTVERERRAAAEINYQPPVEEHIQLAAIKLTGFGRIFKTKVEQQHRLFWRIEKANRVPGIYWDDISVGPTALVRLRKLFLVSLKKSKERTTGTNAVGEDITELVV